MSKKRCLICTDPETHRDLAYMAALASVAANKRVTIKQFLSDLVAREKERIKHD